MATTIDSAPGTDTQFNSGTSATYTGLTVGAGANRTLIAIIMFDSQATSGLTLTWDSGGSNQAMTLIGNQNSFTAGSGSQQVQIWGLVGPTSGNKTLSASWTGAASGYLYALSHVGADQTGGATTFANVQTGTASTSPIALTTAGTANDASVMGVCAEPNVHFTSSNVTNAVYDHSGPGGNFWVDYKSGVGSISDVDSTPFKVGAVAVTIVAASGGAGVTYTQLERGIRGLHRGVAGGSYH